MIDANSQFFAILTNVGMAKLANATALGVSLEFTQMGVGDANNTDPIPSAAQTSLINEWRRQPLNQVRVDPVNAAVIIAEQIIPADVGGHWIREIGLYDAAGDLVEDPPVVARLPARREHRRNPLCVGHGRLSLGEHGKLFAFQPQRRRQNPVRQP